jgi:hypothetical protein
VRSKEIDPSFSEWRSFASEWQAGATLLRTLDAEGNGWRPTGTDSACCNCPRALSLAMKLATSRLPCRSSFQVRVEEGDDSPAGVLGRGLVVPGSPRSSRVSRAGVSYRRGQAREAAGTKVAQTD